MRVLFNVLHITDIQCKISSTVESGEKKWIFEQNYYISGVSVSTLMLLSLKLNLSRLSH